MRGADDGSDMWKHIYLVGAILSQAFGLAGLICLMPMIMLALVIVLIAWPMLQVVETIESSVFSTYEKELNYTNCTSLVYFGILL